MATHSSIHAWKIQWTEELGRLQSMGSLRVRHNWAASLSLFLSCIGEGNGNPLQCSCLENPRDRGAWWAAVDGVAQSRTRLKWLSSSSSIQLYVCKCFWTVVLEKTLESPLDWKEIKLSILMEISPEYSLEGLMLKLQYFSHLMWKTDSLEKTLMQRMIEGRRRRGQQRMRYLDGITSLDMSLSKL